MRAADTQAPGTPWTALYFLWTVQEPPRGNKALFSERRGPLTSTTRPGQCGVQSVSVGSRAPGLWRCAPLQGSGRLGLS